MKQQHSPSKKFTQILKFTVDLSWAWSNCIAWQESLSKIMFFTLTAVPHTPRVQTIQLAGIQKNVFFFFSICRLAWYFPNHPCEMPVETKSDLGSLQPSKAVRGRTGHWCLSGCFASKSNLSLHGLTLPVHYSLLQIER